MDSNVFVRSVALSFERFRFDSSSIYQRPDVLAHRREMQVAHLLACDQQGLSMNYHHSGGLDSSCICHSLDEVDAVVTPADSWLTNDEDALADVRDGRR